MQVTGIVRRIDELGRIVIPKEIRKVLRIRDGENFEIAIENENIVLKKYIVMNKIEEFAQIFTDSIYSFIKKNIIITNIDKIIAVSGPLKKEYLNKEISTDLEKSLLRRENILEKHLKNIKLINDKEETCTYVLNTIIVSGDAVGLIIILSSDDKVNETDEKIAKIVSKFLENQLLI